MIQGTITTDNMVTIIVDGRTFQADRSNPNWDKLVSLPVTCTASEVETLLDVTISLRAAIIHHGNVSIENGQVTFAGVPVHGALTIRILKMVSEGIDVSPWIRFMENVMANPLGMAKYELYEFIEKSDLPITSDGHFLAYKIVRENYFDIYTGMFDNSVGQVLTMNRASVDADRTRTCSVGLHFCSKNYLGNYGSASGSRVMIVKINPADVVSIPTDYDFAKGRTWRYEVVAEMPEGEAKDYLWSSVADVDYVDSDSEDWDDEWSEDEDSDCEMNNDPIDNPLDIPVPKPVVRVTRLRDRVRSWVSKPRG